MSLTSLHIGLPVLSHFPRIGGAEFANHYLASALQRIPNVKVSVACRRMPEVPRSFHYGYPVYQAPKIGKFERKLRKLTRHYMMRREKINLLFGSALHTGGSYAIELKNKYKLPVVVQAHGRDVLTIPEINYGECLNSAFKKRMTGIMQKADHVLAVSNLLKNEILKLGIPSEKVTVIPNGIEHKKIQNIPQTNLRVKYGFAEEDFVILTVGRNVPVKRLNLLLKAFKLLLENNKSFKWVIVGYDPGFKQTIDKQGLNKHVFFTGVLPTNMSERFYPPYPELVNHYRMANLFVSCSYKEAFGITSLEALTCGTPVLVSRQNGIRDIITEGLNGEVFTDESPEGLADAIDNMRLNINNYQSAGITDSVKHLEWDNIAAQTLSVFEKYT